MDASYILIAKARGFTTHWISDIVGKKWVLNRKKWVLNRKKWVLGIP